jgi:hypothetical protein
MALARRFIYPRAYPRVYTGPPIHHDIRTRNVLRVIVTRDVVIQINRMFASCELIAVPQEKAVVRLAERGSGPHPRFS